MVFALILVGLVLVLLTGVPVFAGLVAVAASALLLAVEGYGMVAFSRMVGLMSNGYLAIPMWVPQLLVPIGAVLMLLAALAAFGAAARGAREPPDATLRPPAGIE